MTRRADDGELRPFCDYIVINDEVTARFEVPTNIEVLKGLEIQLQLVRPSEELAGQDEGAGQSITSVTKGVEGVAKHWAIACSIPMFPFSDEELRICVMNGRKYSISGSRKDGIETLSLSYGHIVKEFEKQRVRSGGDFGGGDGHVATKRALLEFSRDHYTIILNVALGKIGDFTMGPSIGDTSTMLPVRLTDALDNIPSALEVLGNMFTLIGDAHPLLKVILTALSIPYKILKTAREFAKSLRGLVDVMRTTCKCLMEVRYHTKIASTRDIFMSITKKLRDVALYLTWYNEKGWFVRAINTQLPKKLENFSEDLLKMKNNFQISVIIQIARDVNPRMTEDHFLQKRLNPAEVPRLGESCLAGTRVNILKVVENWLHSDTSNNILWIVGAPGAGKTTLATTIAKQLKTAAPFCVKFFCKRDVPHLRDPRRIWPTLAYSICNEYNGLKAELMRILDENRDDIQDASVVEQFQQLIKGSLEAVLEETSFQSRPLFIIDALDECYFDDDTNWDSVLDSLKLWATSQVQYKLIITSRDLVDIRQTLGGVCLLVYLTTGENVSDDSKSDMRTFFDNKFESIKKKNTFLYELSGLWPDEMQLQQLSNYAAGLFIWADMVIKYVGMRTGGSNPVRRLEDVLCDIKVQPGRLRTPASSSSGLDQVDRLYARIVFEALRRSGPDELKRAKHILATVLLAKAPLQKSDLVQLLMDTSNPSDVLLSIESTLREFNSIIPAFDTSYGEIRVCHKTVNDFLLSRERSATAMDFVVQQWNQRMPDDRISSNSDLFVLKRENESGCLARACLSLITRSLLKDINNIALLHRLSRGSFDYARKHWLEHLVDANVCQDLVLTSIKNLAMEMEAGHKCLGQLDSDTWPNANQNSSRQEAQTLVKSMIDAANFANNCIEHEILILHSKTYTGRDNPETARIDSSKLAQDIDQYALHVSGASTALLQIWFHPFEQTTLDSKCMEGTRRSILRTAMNWLGDYSQRNILWINGGPGAGKSTIATSLVDEFSKSRICAKAFAKRDFGDRRDPTRIWRTLAFNLASLHAGLKGEIVEAHEESLVRQPKNAIEEEQQRFREYIVTALRKQRSVPAVFVIDALDECFTENNEQWRALLHTLADCIDLPQSFRLVVTSRDIPDIRSALEDASFQISLKIGNKISSDSEVKRDIERYLRMELRDSHLTPLSNKDMKALTMHASGSFIWAKIVADLARNAGAVGTIKDILRGAPAHGAGDIDALYGKMLLDTLGPLDKKSRNITRMSLAAIALARDPLGKSDLFNLVTVDNSSMDERRHLVDHMVEQLSSIISVDENQTLRIPHKSFSDFLLDYARSFAAVSDILSSDPRSYLVNYREDSASIAISCLQLMNSSLKFNACGVETSYLSNSDTIDLDVRISTLVGSSLIYACRFWAEHLKNCNHDDDGFRAIAIPLLKTFLFRKLLYWLETCSLSKSITCAKRSLEMVVNVFRDFGDYDELTDMAGDAHLFVDVFEEPISAAAPHIYLSALPFCPSTSKINAVYGPQYLRKLSVMEGRRKKWDEFVRNESHDGAVFAVAFFPDGKKLVSCSGDKTVRIWAVEGCAASPPFIGHHEVVRGVAVSPDGSRVASGDLGGNLRIWDSDTGICQLGSIKAHEDGIWSVAFSPDGSRLASGSQDQTVKVWNVVTGELCLGPLKGHARDVMSVAFSIDGIAIASGSHDGTIRIWDARTGESVREPLSGHSLVWCVAFSPDGRYLVSGSTDKIKLWAIAQAFTQIAVTVVESGVTSISFSPDSLCLVSGSKDGALRFWNVNPGSCEQIGAPIFGHTNWVRSVAFAPDGSSVASGSGDSGIKTWTSPTISAHHSAQATIESRDPIKFSDLRDGFFIDEDGWMHNSRTDGSNKLFWIPEENRGGVWWARNNAVIHQSVTNFDFGYFVHGNNWTECQCRNTDCEYPLP